MTAATADLRARLEKLKALHAEAQAVIEHFEERSVITAEDATEEDARWIQRYDAVRAEYRRMGHDI